MSSGYDAQDMATQGADGFRNGYQAGHADAVKADERGKPTAAQEAVRPPDGYHYRYPTLYGTGTYIRRNNGEEVNGSKPVEAVPYWYAPVAAAPVEMSPEFTDTARAAIAWVLWHHQGGSSPIGQPLRFALGMGDHEPLPDWRIAEAKRYAELAGATTADFHEGRGSTPTAPVDLHATGLLHVLGATDFADASLIIGNMLALASTTAAPVLDTDLYGWLKARDLVPDSHEGQIDMSEVVEALNEHERQLLASPPAAPGIDNTTPVDRGALQMAINVLRRAGKDEVADALIDASPKGGSDAIAEDEDGMPVGYADWYNRSFSGMPVSTQRDHWCESAWRAAMQATSAEVGS